MSISGNGKKRSARHSHTNVRHESSFQRHFDVLAHRPRFAVCLMDIRGTDKEGLNDKGLWKIVETQKRMLITADKGFANYRDEPHHGIIYCALATAKSEENSFGGITDFYCI